MTRRVLIVAFGFPPTATAGVFRTLRYVKYLREFDWDPVVLTIDPTVTGRGIDESLVESLPDNVPVIRTGISQPDERIKQVLGLGRSRSPADGAGSRPELASTAGGATRRANTWRPTSWARYLWEFAFQTPDDKIGWWRPAVRAAKEAVKRYQPTVVYSTGPPHSTNVIGSAISRAVRLPHVADFRDPWARAPWRATERNPWGYRLHGLFERRMVSRANQVILNTTRLAEEFRHTYPQQREKFRVITNGFDPDHLPFVRRLTAPTSSGGEFVLCHPGTLYNQRDPRPLLEAIRRFHTEDTPVVFEQIGSHDPEFELSRLAGVPGLEGRVRLVSRVPHEDVFCRMAKASALVLLQPGTHLQVPGKLFEMVMFEKPILALAEDGATADIVNEYGLGVVAAPDDPQRIGVALRQLRAGEYRGGRWEQALSDFDGRRLTKSLAECLSCAAP